MALLALLSTFVFILHNASEIIICCGDVVHCSYRRWWKEQDEQIKLITGEMLLVAKQNALLLSSSAQSYGLLLRQKTQIE